DRKGGLMVDLCPGMAAFEPAPVLAAGDGDHFTSMVPQLGDDFDGIRQAAKTISEIERNDEMIYQSEQLRKFWPITSFKVGHNRDTGFARNPRRANHPRRTKMIDDQDST